MVVQNNIILLNITKNILTLFSVLCVGMANFAEHHKEHSDIFLSVLCVWEWLILLNITKNVLTFFSLFCVWEGLTRTIHHFTEHHKEHSDIFLSVLCVEMANFAEHHKERSDIFLSVLCAGMAVQNSSSFC